jgi:hypothetical protein
VSEQPDDSGNWSDERARGSLDAFERLLAARFGSVYREIADDAGKREARLHDANPRYRILALHLYGSGAIPSHSAYDRIVAMATSDPNDGVRGCAVRTLCTLPRSSRAHEIMTLFARIALDEDEPETVRKAAYESAVLFEPEFEKTDHILRHKKWSTSDVTLSDFDTEFLKSMLTRSEGHSDGNENANGP